MSKWCLTGNKIYMSDSDVKSGTIAIENGYIEGVSKRNVSAPISVNIENGVIVPGLINSHDHLLGTYWPKVGNGPYENWLPWDNDLKSSPVYQERQQIENRDLYLLGGYRNLVSGVTTVSDHIPHFVAEPYYDILPMKALRDYALAHAVASFALPWGEGIDIEYERAVLNDIAFITHIAEGFDNETIRDLATLDRQGGLGNHSVLVHGIAFTESDMKLIKKKGGSVVWCADSNVFMFDKTTDIKLLLDLGVNVCIGTDSPMSGGQNLLTEIKFDKNFYNEYYGEEISDEQLVKMVTVNPAKAFHLHELGQLKQGNIADITVFRDKEDSPSSSIVNAELKDVMLVVINGNPVYGDIEYHELFDDLGVQYQEVVIDGKDKIIIGDLLGLVRRISKAVGFKKEFPFLPVDFDI